MKNKNGETSIIPKGAIFATHPFYLHRNENHWPNPEKFDPQVFKKILKIYILFGHVTGSIKSKIIVFSFKTYGFLSRDLDSNWNIGSDS